MTRIYTEIKRNEFFNKIENNNQLNINDCWKWNGSIDKRTNYPIFNATGKYLSAVKIAYEMFYNVQTTGKILKICNNTSCINPHHMLLPASLKYFNYYTKFGNDDECWEWQGRLSEKGYGVMSQSGNSLLAHRYSYDQTFGIKNPNMFICHECDNPRCVNPNHLFEGTVIDNNLDRDNKNRQSKGEHRPSSKLTDNQVYEIKYNSIGITQSILAKKFDISECTISFIQNGKRWKHI